MSEEKKIPTHTEQVEFYKKAVQVQKLRTELMELRARAAKAQLEETSWYNQLAQYDQRQRQAEKESNEIEYELTQEDFDNNPGLEEQGLKVGDIVNIPKDQLEDFLKKELKETILEETPSKED